MAIAWNEIFEHFGVKQVTKTDKSKAAYVLSAEQLAAVSAAGIQPSSQRPATPFDVTLLFDARASVRATFYHAMRAAAGRTPEPRLGTEFISSWLNEGDTVVIGNIGSQLYAAKVSSAEISDIEAADAVARKATPANRQALIAKAKKAAGKPAKKQVTRSDFVRDPAVVMGAIARANGRCEMPGCTCALFERMDGTVYLEVHHIKRLADEGEDTLENAAALCPSCHRQLHHGANQAELQRALAAYIRST